MKKIREVARQWGFPVAMIVTWIMAAAYTLSLMVENHDRTRSDSAPPPAAAATESHAS